MSSWGELLGFLAPNTATNANHTAAGRSLSGVSPRSLTPQTPSSHPFPTSQSFPRSITSLGGITWGVCVCVRVFGLCNHVSTCEQEGKREKKKRFLLNVPFEQLWVERSGVNPSFPFSL